MKKNVKRNILFVSHGYDPEKVYKDHIRMDELHFITANPWEEPEQPHAVTFKIRHTPEFLRGILSRQADGSWFLQADERIHGVAQGQFCVIYDERHHLCFGSGEIA